MAKVVGDIAVQVGADVSPLQRSMGKASGSIRGFESDAQKMAQNFVKVGATVATASAAVATAVFAMAREASAAATNINNLSTLAGIGTTDFQKYAAASKTVGIEQEKLADILKDVNDKFGDYMATGAGPLADFFENIAPKIGVTADQFARLSGPEALQLYVSSLEQAGVSQQQMTFYMEALASDATALVPLLRDNGAAMRDLGRAAENAGRVMSEDTIASGVELGRVLTDISETLRTSVNEAVLENAEDLQELARITAEVLIPAMANLVSGLASVVTGLASVGAAAIENGGKLLDFLNNADEVSTGSQGRRQQRNGTGGTINAPADDGFTVIEPGGPLGRQEGAGRNPGIFAADLNPGEGSEAGRGVPYFPPAALIEEQAAATAEAVAAGFEEIESVERQHASRVREVREKSAEELAAIDKASNALRFQEMSTALSNASSLMQSENKKLFKIGQAAAVADATISGIRAAVEAYEAGMATGGPFAPGIAAAYAAASLARTGMMIQQIKSASPSGGGGGGAAMAGGGGVPSTAPAEAAPQRASVNLTLIGDQGFSRAQIIQITEAMNDATGDGSKPILNIRGQR